MFILSFSLFCNPHTLATGESKYFDNSKMLASATGSKVTFIKTKNKNIEKTITVTHYTNHINVRFH